MTWALDDIVSRMDYAVETLINLKLDKVEPQTIEEINSHIKTISTASSYFPG